MSIGAERLIVVQDGVLLGLLTRASIGNFIEQRHPSVGHPAPPMLCHRMLKMVVQQGRSEVHGAKNMSATSVDAGEAVSRQCLGGEAISFLPTHPEPAKAGSFSVGGTLRA